MFSYSVTHGEKSSRHVISAQEISDLRNPGLVVKRSGGGNIAFFGNVLLDNVSKCIYLAILLRKAKKIVHMS